MKAGTFDDFPVVDLPAEWLGKLTIGDVRRAIPNSGCSCALAEMIKRSFPGCSGVKVRKTVVYIACADLGVAYRASFSRHVAFLINHFDRIVGGCWLPGTEVLLMPATDPRSAVSKKAPLGTRGQDQGTSVRRSSATRATDRYKSNR